MRIRYIPRLVRAWIERKEEADGIRDEMELHRELRARKLRENGMTGDDAVFHARRQFGNAALYRDQIWDLWGWGMWERFLQDVRYGARALTKAPGFTAIAVLTLALALGINTAIFSAVNAVMLRPLPYPQPHRLVSLWEEVTRPPSPQQNYSSNGAQSGSAGKATRTTVSVANLADYKKSSGLEDLAAYSLTPMNLTGIGAPERVDAESVTWNFFSVLRVSPARGRTFLPDEDKAGANLVAIVSDGFWRRRLGGAANALENSIMLDGKRYRIVGILPAGFQSPLQLGSKTTTELYVPASYSSDLLTNRGDHEVNAVGRLSPGVSVTSAQAALSATSNSLRKQFPGTNQWIRAAIAPLEDDLAGSVKTALLALLGASGLIVLIACVNVANLLMVRAAGRRHESSVRLALGSGRIGLIRQLLTESILIAGAGCAAGIALGLAMMAGLRAIAPPGIPRIESTGMDWRVFAVSAAVALVTALVFGMAPAWQASQANPGDVLRIGARGMGGTSQARWRKALTIAEVSLSLILMVGAALLLRSFGALMGVDLGFQTDRVIAMNVNLPQTRYPDGAARLRFFEELESRVRALPGIQSVAYANRLPMRGGWSSGIFVDGDQNRQADPDFQAVNPGYFETLGIPLLRGRGLTAQDTARTLPVAVVNLAFARQVLDGADPLGHSMQRSPTAPKIVVVGVVNDIRRSGKEGKIKPEVYLCAGQTQLYPVGLSDLAVRTVSDPRALLNAISGEVWAIDKDQPVTNVRTLDQIVDEAVAQRRFQTLLLAIFASVAAVLAIVGIYGVLAYSVSQRTPELGVRIALGAAPGSIVRLVFNEAGVMISAGIVAGLAGAYGLTRFLQDLLFQVKATDWRAYLAAVILLAAVGLVAATVPARRGARMDPMVALRQE